MKKSFEALTVSDILSFPIWKFTNSSENDLEIESQYSQQFNNLDGLIVGSRVTFVDGSQYWALFQNISLKGSKINDHTLTLTIENEGAWFPLARYHDIDINKNGPSQLALFMGKKIENIFPIHYDLRTVLNNYSDNLVGFVYEMPQTPLTRTQIVSLALE